MPIVFFPRLSSTCFHLLSTFTRKKKNSAAFVQFE
jgi:hypothetical protein